MVREDLMGTPNIDVLYGQQAKLLSFQVLLAGEISIPS